jgi:hypothetical protein
MLFYRVEAIRMELAHTQVASWFAGRALMLCKPPAQEQPQCLIVFRERRFPLLEEYRRCRAKRTRSLCPGRATRSRSRVPLCNTVVRVRHLRPGFRAPSRQAASFYHCVPHSSLCRKTTRAPSQGNNHARGLGRPSRGDPLDSIFERNSLTFKSNGLTSVRFIAYL